MKAKRMVHRLARMLVQLKARELDKLSEVRLETRRR